jgi:hypothetical protein
VEGKPIEISDVRFLVWVKSGSTSLGAALLAVAVFIAQARITRRIQTRSKTRELAIRLRTHLDDFDQAVKRGERPFALPDWVRDRSFGEWSYLFFCDRYQAFTNRFSKETLLWNSALSSAAEVEDAIKSLRLMLK